MRLSSMLSAHWVRRLCSGRLVRCVVAAGLLGLVAPAGASASFLVYRCGGSFENLCRVNPDGSGRSQLTTDGNAGGAYYQSPSLSRDGVHLAFLLGANVFTSDANAQNRSALISGSAIEAHMAPDGSRVMAVRYGDSQSPQVASILSWALDGSDQHFERYGTFTAGWAGGDELGNGEGTGIPNRDPHSICLLTPVETRPRSCARTVASDPTRDVFLPELSPDGSTLAVVLATPGGPSTIAAYNYSTGAFERDLTGGTEDTTPTWSPDGQSLAFQRGTALYRVPAAGGQPQLITTGGEQPTWGGPPDQTTNGGSSNGTQHDCHVPRLLHRTVSAAKVALYLHGCRPGKVKTKHSAKRNRGRVISQSIPAGKHVALHRKINLVIGR
jgi:hypothetical protein